MGLISRQPRCVDNSTSPPGVLNPGLPSLSPGAKRLWSLPRHSLPARTSSAKCLAPAAALGLTLLLPAQSRATPKHKSTSLGLSSPSGKPETLCHRGGQNPFPQRPVHPPGVTLLPKCPGRGCNRARAQGSAPQLAMAPQAWGETLACVMLTPLNHTRNLAPATNSSYQTAA